MSPPPIRLFVYGTLKRGLGNHARFCAQATDVAPAVIWGRLYALDVGYPALEVPPARILGHGTDDPLHDAGTAASLDPPPFTRPRGDWDLIEGELLTLADPARDLPPVDRLEGFRPGRNSLYRRVLVAVGCGRAAVAAWSYDGAGLAQRGVRVTHWPDS